MMRGTEAQLTEAIGVTPDNFEKYLDATMSFFSTDLANKGEGMGYDGDNAWVDIDFQTGMANIMVNGYTTDISFPASDIKDHYKSVSKKKVAKDKKAKVERMNIKIKNYSNYGIEPTKDTNPWGNF
jgi:hypothetical protein